MANIIYDGGTTSQAQNMITFTDFPNILRIEDNVSSSRAYFNLEIMGNLGSETENDNQWYITIYGDTITNVMSPQNAVNKSFYISYDNTSTAASIVKALRNCPNVAANFKVWHEANEITIQARDGGSLFNGQTVFNTNIDDDYLYVSQHDGYGSSLQGSKIDVDIYSEGEYITTLEKTFYGQGCEFNVSPTLTTMARYGETVPYSFTISSIGSNGGYSLLGYLNTNYITYGYLCNQGNGILVLNGSTPILAQNVSRGDNRGYTNNTRLYTYFPNIRLSFYNQGTSPTFTIKYLDSAMNQIYSTTSGAHILYYDSRLKDVSIDLSSTYFSQAFYIVVEFGSYSLLYEVIKPLKAAEGAQRIYWRNSYGGVSFVDMTGQHSETRNLENTTYQENIYDAVKATIKEYTNGSTQNVPYNELTKVYNTKVDYTVTLKSHLFEEDGKWLYNDLVQSSKVWTKVNDNFYEIILDSVSVEEQNNNNGIYEATIKYKYSQVPSEIE